MEQEPGSGSNTSKIEVSSEGGSTSSSDKREGDRDLEGSQDPGTTSEQVERTRVTDTPNRINDVAGLQTTGAREDPDNSEDSDNSGDLDHISEQGGGPSVTTEENVSSEDLSLKTNSSTEGSVTGPFDKEDILTISTRNADNQQTSDDWTMVDHVKSDAETVGKGEVCRQMEKNSGIINEVQQQITNLQISLHSDDTPRAKSLKNDRPVVAKVSETGGESTADNVSKDVQASETDCQATREESCEVSGAASQGLKSLPVGVEFVTSEPNLVVFNSQCLVVLSHSSSVKETLSHPKPLDTLHPSKSLKETSKSPRELIKLSNSLKVIRTSEEALSTVSISGTQKEINICSEAPSTGPSEAQVEIGMGQEDPSLESGSAAQEESSEISEAPSTVLISGTQKELNISSEASSTASTSEVQEEVGMSQDDPSSVSGSAAQEESSEISEAPSTVLISGTQNESNISSEASSTASTSEVQEEVGMSQDDPSSVSGFATEEESREISEAPSMVLNLEIQKEVSLSTENPRTVSRSESLKEVFMSPKAASEVSAFEVQERSSIISEAPCSVPTSRAQIVGVSQEALSMVSHSVVQKDIDSISEPFSTLSISEAQEEVSVTSEASRMLSNPEVPNDVGVSSDSSSTVPTAEAQEEIRKSSETSKMVSNSEVQNEVGLSADALSRACEAEQEISVSSETPSTMSTSKAQKDFGTSPEEIIPRAEISSRGSAPESLQRKASDTSEENIRNLPQKPSQQSETSVSDAREGLPRARSGEGKVTSVLEGDARESDQPRTSSLAFRYEEQLGQKDKTISALDKKVKQKEALSSHFRGRLQGLQQDYDELCNNFEQLGRNHVELQRNHVELLRNYQELNRAYREKEIECSRHSATAQSYAISYSRLKNNMTEEIDNKEKLIRDWRGQLAQMKKENVTLQDQMSLYEQQHANEQSRGGSYLDDTKAATPALLVSALNGVKDSSNNFVKVLKNSIQPGIDTAELEANIGTVSRNGHIKFQYQAYICRILFGDFDLPHPGSSKVTPTTYFRQYQMHDLKKTDTVERLLHYDREIDGSLHEFCFDKFLKLMVDIQHLLTDRSIDLGKLVQSKQHPRDSKLYVSFCKLAVSVWLLQRLAFSFLHPAKQFVADRGDPFDFNRMQSVVPLDEPGSDEEVQLRVGFYVLPGFDIGNSAIPCEVYVASK